MGRAPCCDKANVKKGPWSPDEDAKLKAYIEEHGAVGNWIALPHKIGLKRCGKSCRLRWLNYLRPNIKHGEFTEEEDHIICSLFISIGSRWSIIAAQLPGRTDNDIKNYWNTRLKKKLLGNHRRRRRDLPPPSRAPSASALERLQVHMQLQGLCNNTLSFYDHPALWPKIASPHLNAIVAAPATQTTYGSSPENKHGMPSSTFQDFTIQQPNSGIDSEVEKLRELIRGLQEDPLQVSKLDRFGELDGGRENFKVLVSNGLEEKSTSSSSSSSSSLRSWGLEPEIQADAIIQEFMLGYDLYS